MLRTVFSWIVITAVGIGFLHGAMQEPSSAGATAASPHRALLNRYCVTCHNERLRTAELTLDKMDLENVSQEAATWEKVVRKLRTGAMPPAGLPRPEKAGYDALATYLETSLDRAAAANLNPGRPAPQRLHRTAYTNAIRDLLALEIDGEALLPPDESTEGFDNIGDVLSISPLLLERYLLAGRKIARLAVGDPGTGVNFETYDVPKYLMQGDRMSEDLPFGSRGGVAIRHYFPLDGEYTVRIVLQKDSRDYIRGLAEPHPLDVRLDGARIKQFTVGGETVREGDFISFDGLTGEVKLAKVASKPSEILQVLSGEMKEKDSDLYRRFKQILTWSDKFRRLGIRANADQPDQAELAYAFGARGIGLCRTEHMFFGEGRIPIVQRMILATTEQDRRAALAELLPMQRKDFYGVFKAMHGEPVTIRTIDPPLHEFLPKREELMVEIAKLEASGKKGRVLQDKQKLLHRVEQLHEFNPMLGHRGVRLGITYPEITEMQTRAIIEAACQLAKEGIKVTPEIMIPLVGLVKELKDQKAVVERVAAEVMKERGVKVKYLVGTMIEVPRGAMTADQIAKEAQFFSFGTNDLTQLAFGFSRDDIGKFLRVYQDKKILDKDPFATFDVEGVGPIVRTAVELGRKARPDIKLGVCGEHGGDAASIHFFENVGLDYVSCSPYRVPVARLAAAQAALSVKVGD